MIVQKVSGLSTAILRAAFSRTYIYSSIKGKSPNLLSFCRLLKRGLLFHFPLAGNFKAATYFEIVLSKMAVATK